VVKQSALLPKHWPPAFCVALIVAIVIVAALTEIGLGRPIVSKSGRVLLWVGDPNSAETSQQLTDWYTFTHVVHGFLFYAALRLIVRRRPVMAPAGVAAVFVEAAWEVSENTPYVIERYRAATIALGYYGDTVLNSMSDILACALGFLLARFLPVRASVALVLGFELGLLYFIRDNLTLNILMLLHPFESIKQWQSAAGG
jgi:hypothetical protein